MDGACPQDGLEGLLRNNGPCGRGWEEKRTTGLTFLRRRPQGGEDRTVGAVETVPAIHGQPSGLRSSLGLPRHPLVVTRVLARRWQARVWGRSPSRHARPGPSLAGAGVGTQPRVGAVSGAACDAQKLPSAGLRSRPHWCWFSLLVLLPARLTVSHRRHAGLPRRLHRIALLRPVWGLRPEAAVIIRSGSLQKQGTTRWLSASNTTI